MVNDLAASTGLSREVIIYHLDLSSLIDDLFSQITEKGVETMHLFGGTAINRAFFGKNQRFSIDLDLNYNGSDMGKATSELRAILGPAGYKVGKQEWMNSKHTLKRLFVESTGGRRAGFDIDIHLKKEDAPYKRLVLHSITEYFGYMPIKTIAQSYTFEFLLAGKLFALKDRALDRDVYDTYMCLQETADYGKVRKYIEEYESFPQLVGIINNKLEKLVETNRKIEISRYIPSYCIRDFNLMASEINRKLMGMV